VQFVDLTFSPRSIQRQDKSTGDKAGYSGLPGRSMCLAKLLMLCSVLLVIAVMSFEPTSGSYMHSIESSLCTHG